MTNKKSIVPLINDTDATEVVLTNKWLSEKVANFLDNSFFDYMAQTSHFFRHHFQEKIDAIAACTVGQMALGLYHSIVLMKNGTVKAYGLRSDVLGLGNNRESQLTPTDHEPKNTCCCLT